MAAAGNAGSTSSAAAATTVRSAVAGSGKGQAEAQASDETRPLMWFRSGVRLGELEDCKLWPPKIEMTVTGHTRRAKDPKRPKELGKLVEVNGSEVVLFRWEDTPFASGSRCPHMKGRIEQGDIEDLDAEAVRWRRPAPSASPGLGLDDDFDDGVGSSTVEEECAVARLCVTCPLHGYQFDVHSGVSVMPEGTFHLPMHPARLREEDGCDDVADMEIEVGFYSFGQAAFESDDF
jgi:nitrite reductase/ring-hydroxylating ferredoxin subunit